MTFLTKQKLTFTAFAVVLLSAIGIGMAFMRDADFTVPLRSMASHLTRGEYARFKGESFFSSLLAMFGVDGANANAEETENSVPVLLYHGIVVSNDRFSITPGSFKEQMYTLKRAGYQTITLDDFYAFQRGEKKLPKRSFLLTFDDGRRDSFEGADPVLEALGFKAVMFMPAAETVPDPKWLSSYYLGLKDIKKMIASGRWMIGSHAVQKNGGFVPISPTEKGNFLSNKSWLPDQDRLETDEEYRARITHEITDSKRGLESEFHVTVDAMSFPFGDYGQQTVNHPEARAAVAEITGQTYRIAFRQVWQHDGDFIMNHASDPRLALKRVETPTSWSGERLVQYLEGGIEKPLTFTDDFTNDAGWRTTWGASDLNDARLTMAAKETSGASVFLDGTRLWKDYTFRTTFDWSSGTNVSLMARYKNGKNYLSCTFGEGNVSISNTVNGETVRIQTVKNASPIAAGGETSLGMNVRGNTATCYSGATPVVMATVPDTDGGIGIRIWDPNRDVAKAQFKSVEVTPL